MLARIPAAAAPELELKFQIGPDAVASLADSFPAKATQSSRLQAVYFDTPSHALRDAGYSLRVRRDGDVYTQTLKHRADGGLFERDEWETDVAGPHLDMAVLDATPAKDVVGDARLEAVFAVAFERQLFVWTHDNDAVQISVDTGLISAGDKTEPVAELELELIKGTPSTLFGLARTLQDKMAMTLAFASKAERGYRLAGHDGTAALEARRAAIGPETTAGEAFQIVARDSLIQIAGNSALLQRSNNPEILHQVRVGLRRFRTALKAFKTVLDPGGLSVARTETRWLAGELALARDLDVFLQNTDRPDDVDENSGRAAFLQALRIAQAEAYERALAAIRSPRYDRLLLSMGEWIEAGRWLRMDDKDRRDLRNAPVAALAVPLMDRWHGRLLARSRGLAGLAIPARHKVRKQARTLRYAAAFFGDAVVKHPRRRAAFMARLRAVQDRLGELNDMAIAKNIAERTVGTGSGALAFAAGLELGRMTQQEPTVLDAAKQAVKAYRQCKVFWSRRSKDLNH